MYGLVVEVGKGAVFGAVYSLMNFLDRKRKTQNQRNVEKFSFRKFARSLVIGGVFGAVLASTGVVVTFESMPELVAGNMVVYSGVVWFVEFVLKNVWKTVKKN